MARQAASAGRPLRHDLGMGPGRTYYRYGQRISFLECFTRFRDPEDAVYITNARVAENMSGRSELLAILVWVTNSLALDAKMHLTMLTFLVVLAGVAPTFFMYRATDLSYHPLGC